MKIVLTFLFVLLFFSLKQTKNIKKAFIKQTKNFHLIFKLFKVTPHNNTFKTLTIINKTCPFKLKLIKLANKNKKLNYICKCI